MSDASTERKSSVKNEPSTLPCGSSIHADARKRFIRKAIETEMYHYLKQVVALVVLWYNLNLASDRYDVMIPTSRLKERGTHMIWLVIYEYLKTMFQSFPPFALDVVLVLTLRDGIRSAMYYHCLEHQGVLDFTNDRNSHPLLALLFVYLTALGIYCLLLLTASSVSSTMYQFDWANYLAGQKDYFAAGGVPVFARDSSDTEAKLVSINNYINRLIDDRSRHVEHDGVCNRHRDQVERSFQAFVVIDERVIRHHLSHHDVIKESGATTLQDAVRHVVDIYPSIEANAPESAFDCTSHWSTDMWPLRLLLDNRVSQARMLLCGLMFTCLNVMTFVLLGFHLWADVRDVRGGHYEDVGGIAANFIYLFQICIIIVRMLRVLSRSRFRSTTLVPDGLSEKVGIACEIVDSSGDRKEEAVTERAISYDNPERSIALDKNPGVDISHSQQQESFLQPAIMRDLELRVSESESRSLQADERASLAEQHLVEAETRIEELLAQCEHAAQRVAEAEAQILQADQRVAEAEAHAEERVAHAEERVAHAEERVAHAEERV
eukprot:CAMPEP_0117472860 /NCGR_PEP_ID=MMETSP0784-20121206/8468_1 /TAXON_ID=39447 /ORGANISM="" /LENGTH=549 /DNA_ID=CAMNT_0005267031 /DNA_START=68 /DNA_END=1714 /DNA_ORIENTATION=+